MLTSLKTKAVFATAVGASVAMLLPMAAASAAVPAKTTGALPTIVVTMNGKTISVSGATQSGGVEVVSKVGGKEAQASPVFVRLDTGVTLAQFESALPDIGADPNNIIGIGTIVFSVQANHGTSEAQVNLTPGNYVALDISPRIPNLVPFTVTAASAPATLPKPGATLASIEFGFRGATRLHDGELVRFANHGFLVHMMVAVRAKNLKGAREIAKLLKAGKDGKAQRLATDFYSYFNALTHNSYIQQIVRQRPGFWVIACFMDTQDHREHTTLGMERVIQIVK